MPSGHYPLMVQYNRWMTGKLCPVYASFFGALRTERQPLDARIEAWAEHRDREWLAAPFH